jgi:DNA-binding transcriptional MerR regulator
VTPFHFTITDAARFLGKSPVTLRKWERQGLVAYPRLNGSGDRYFKLGDIRSLVARARDLGRVSEVRAQQIYATVTLLELIERDNRKV